MSRGFALTVFNRERIGDTGSAAVAETAASEIQTTVRQQIDAARIDANKPDDGGDPSDRITVSMEPQVVDVAVNETRVVNLSVDNNGVERISAEELNLTVESGSINPIGVSVPPSQNATILAEVQATEPGRHAVRHGQNQIGTVNATYVFCSDEFFINGTIESSTVMPGDAVTASLTVENIWSCPLTREVNITVGGRELVSETVSAAANSTQQMTLTFTAPSRAAIGSGVHDVEANGIRLASIDYAAPTTEGGVSGPGLPGFGPLVAAMGLLAVGGWARWHGGGED
jgi:hypothetical protein